MRSPIRRLAGMLCASVALSLIVASVGTAAASAATTATTQAATAVETTSAMLEGQIGTDGAATQWQFQWGTDTSYANATTAETIAAGSSTVNVSAKLTGLIGGETYHFRLVARSGTGTAYYPLVSSFGADQRFTTVKTGSVTLTNTAISVRNRTASFPFTCTSSKACKGNVLLTYRQKVGKKFHTLTFAKTAFSLRPGQKGTVKLKVSKAAAKLLRRAPGHRLRVSFTAKFGTGQKKITKTITLSLK
jgi:hypothetical protein